MLVTSVDYGGGCYHLLEVARLSERVGAECALILAANAPKAPLVVFVEPNDPNR